MADAIIFDDGGSTRIKQLGHKLDDLLDNSKDFAPGPFNKLRISCVDEAGVAGPPTGGGGLFPITDCQITVSGVNNIDPIIEARHSKGQRRYIVSNAPSIAKVEVNAQGPVQTFPIPAGTIYTVVILSKT
jgi:hypothetical protein